jgi:hypothetical protein
MMVTETTGFENVDTQTLRNLWLAGFGDDKVLCTELESLIKQGTELGMIGLMVCRRQQARSVNLSTDKKVREFYYVLEEADADS